MKIISLGGSLIVPNEIDTSYLKKLKTLLKSQKEKIIIVCGGGKTARNYINAAKKITNATKHQLDHLGIMATEINAQLVKTALNVKTPIQHNPNKKHKFNKILLMKGFQPGGSSDLDTVILAKTYKTFEVINLSDTYYIHNKNPKKYKNAKPYKNLTWNEYTKIVGTKFTSGMHVPFDPVASKYAQNHNIKLIHTNGKDLNNLKKILNNEKFKGTIIN
jgi:uridylate kinase